MSLINVGIIGSCVSRDNFNSMFNAGYTRLFNCKMYIGHITVPSLISGKIEYNEEDIYIDNPDEFEIVKRELSRSYLEELKDSSDLDYLIIDFYSDVYYGIVMVDNDHVFTDHYQRVATTKFYSELENKKFLSLHDNPDEYFEIWKKSLNELVLLIKSIMPNVKILINKARAVEQYKDQDGNVKKIKTDRDANEINELWDRLDDYCIKTFGFQYLDLSVKDYLADEYHPFGGPRAVHYTKDFYENFMTELSSIAVQNAQIDLYKSIEKNNHMNLIDNSNFEFGTDHWSFWQSNFQIADNKVEINNIDLEQDKYNILLSNPIKVKIGEAYNLSFKVFVDSDREFDSDKIIFYLRIFKHPTKIFQKDAEWHENLYYPNFIDENCRNEWITVKYSFIAKKNGFLKVGPGIAKNGHVVWKDIYLTNDVSNSSWNPSYKDIMNKNMKLIQENVIKSEDPELSNINLNIKEKLEKEQQLKSQIQDLSLEIQNLTLEQYEFHKKRTKEEKLLKNKIKKYENKIEKYENSTSWLITSPLRRISSIIKNIRK
jgi:hypothetical protein